MDKQSNFIGMYFRMYIENCGISGKALAKRLGYNYANNERMICAYKAKKDYLWRQTEVRDWCNALHINEKLPIYNQLMCKAGKKDIDNAEDNE